mgnify:FL=1
MFKIIGISVNYNMRWMKLINVLILFLLVFQFTNLKAEVVKPVYLQSVASDITMPSGIELSPDGTKVFMTSYATSALARQYTLSTPFNISSLDASSVVNLNLNDGGDDNLSTAQYMIQGLTFNNDGSKIFAIDQDGKLNVHTLAAPYDFSNPTQLADDGLQFGGSETTHGDPGDENIRPHDLRFNNDGTKMYTFEAVHNGSEVPIIEYDLSTPFTPGSATLGRELDVKNIPNTTLQDIDFDDDGTRLYLVESSGSNTVNQEIYVWKLSTAFDVSTAIYQGKLPLTFNAAGTQGGTPIGITFANEGMKFYVTDYKNNKIHEFDLICPYGIVICELDETNVQTDTASQIEFAKDVIKHNTSTIFRRFDWLRRNENNLRSYSNNINLNLSQIFGSLPEEIEKPLTDAIYSKVSTLIQKNKRENKKWSLWSHGDLTIGERDSIGLNPREIKTSGLTLGMDRKFKNDKVFGLALRYGNEDTDILRSSNKFETEALSLNFYGQIKLNEKINLNSIIGTSILEIDKLKTGINTGSRNGKQIFSAISLEASDGFTNLNIMPTAKIDFGITELSKYNQFNTSNDILAVHDLLTFENGNLTTGLKFDNLKDISNGKRSINGSFEYVHDFTSDINYKFKNSGDSYQSKLYNSNSIHNLKSNIGFERILYNGFTFGLNYENFQSFEKNTLNQDSLYLKLSRVRDKHTRVALDYDPLQDQNLEFSYTYVINGLDVLINSNYDFSEVSDYGANIELSATF